MKMVCVVLWSDSSSSDFLEAALLVVHRSNIFFFRGKTLNYLLTNLDVALV